MIFLNNYFLFYVDLIKNFSSVCMRSLSCMYVLYITLYICMYVYRGRHETRIYMIYTSCCFFFRTIFPFTLLILLSWFWYFFRTCIFLILIFILFVEKYISQITRLVLVLYFILFLHYTKISPSRPTVLLNNRKRRSHIDFVCAVYVCRRGSLLCCVVYFCVD